MRIVLGTASFANSVIALLCLLKRIFPNPSIKKLKLSSYCLIVEIFVNLIKSLWHALDPVSTTMVFGRAFGGFLLGIYLPLELGVNLIIV